MQTWEYLVLQYDELFQWAFFEGYFSENTLFEERFNNLGRDGWELVSSTPISLDTVAGMVGQDRTVTKYAFIFKRPIE